MKHLVLLIAGALILPLYGADDPLHEIFYVPFEDSIDASIARGQGKAISGMVDGYETGVVGKAVKSVKKYNGLKWDARGNVDLDRGTIAFFYKPLWKIDVHEWFPFAGVSTDIEGYWNCVLDFIIRKDNFQFQLFDISRYTQHCEGGSILSRWKTGEWIHLAAVWDRNQGTRLYENGKLIGSTWNRYLWLWNLDPRILAIGEAVYSTRPFAADELHVYAECLTDEQIAQLAKGEKPTGNPRPPLPATQVRERNLERLAWTTADLKEIPTLEPGKGLEFTFARIDHAIDAKRQIAQPFAGLKAWCWPLAKYGTLLSGRLLEIYPSAGAEFDRIRIFSQNHGVGCIMESDAIHGLKPVLKVDAVRPFWRGSFDRLRKDPVVLFQRERGSFSQFDLYRVAQADPDRIPVAPVTWTSASRLNPVPPTPSGLALLGETPFAFQNAVRATAQGANAWELSSPAFGGFQMLTEELAPLTPAHGVVIHLATLGLKVATPVRLVVKEPIWPQRDWLTADVILQPGKSHRADYTVILRGRPVISPPEGTLTRGKVALPQPRIELAMTVTAAEPVRWAMGKGGTRVSLLPAKIEEVKPTVVADQIEFMREAYAQMMEGHIWDGHPMEQWGSLAWPLRYLLLLAPNERPVMQVATATGFRTGSLPWNPPTNATGAPEWAFWQLQAMNANKRIVEWIIDNRQVSNGEFGGVYGDDTDMCEEWGNYALSGDDSGKIHRALRLLWDGLWNYNLVEGVSRTIRDNLHSYEEGQGTIAQALLIDYGNPVNIERVMTSTSHLDPKWMKKNADGSYSFRSWYFGQSGVWTEGDFGRDHLVNNLMLVPGAYLAWYNRHPYATEHLLKWKLNMKGEAYGIVGDALYQLRKDADPAVVKLYEGRADQSITAGSRYLPMINFVDALGFLKPEWRAKFLSTGTNSQFYTKLPYSPSYSTTMTDAHWLAWRASGDVNYLVRSYKKTCELLNNLDWIYTVAQPSTDRVPLPHSTVTRARMGSAAVHRAGNDSFWPLHGLSYTKGADTVAALVTENTTTNLSARFWSFDPHEHDLQLRVWQLLPGQYTVTLAHDSDHDGKPESVISRTTTQLVRGSFLDLKLPPRQGVVLDVKALKVTTPNYDLPDPAIGPGDVSLEFASGHLSVTVHNVGVRPVKNLMVRVRDNASRAVVGETIVPLLEAPLDLKPRTVTLEFHNIDCVTRGSLTVELDPEGKVEDLNRFNNKVVYEY